MAVTPARLIYPGLAALVLLAFAVFIHGRALNMPYHDDILDVLKFVLAMRDAGSLGDQLGALFLQYNDHRTGASRLVYYLLYLLQGEVNFRSISFAANAAIPLLGLMYIASLKDDARSSWAAFALLAALIMCQPRAYGLMLWAMSSFAFYYVCVYALLSMFLLHRSGAGFLFLAILAAWACSFTLASGQVIW